MDGSRAYRVEARPVGSLHFIHVASDTRSDAACCLAESYFINNAVTEVRVGKWVGPNFIIVRDGKHEAVWRKFV